MEDELIHESFEGSPFVEASVSGTVIRNVKLLGMISRNGRRYSEKALQDAVELYPNAPVFFDHPTDREMRERKGTRSVRDLAGKIRNPRRVNGEIRGDVQLIDVKEGGVSPAAFITAIAEQMPDIMGFSHRAQGKVVKGENGDVVESLTRVFAQELVTDPATTNGLFESLQTDGDDPSKPEGEGMEIKDLTLESLRKNRPDLIEAVEAEIREGEDVAALKKERDDLKDKLELREAEDRKAEHASMIATKLAEAKLPEDVVTETFKRQLSEAKDEGAVDELIADRKTLAEARKTKGPRSVERNVEETIRQRGTFEDVTDDKLEEAVTALFN